MTREIESRIRTSVEELAAAAPLANPEHPRPRTGPPARPGPHVDVKLLTLLGCLLILIGTLIAIGVEARHHGNRPAATTTTTLPSTTTSLPHSGPLAVPNVLGLTVVQAADELRAVGLTNSIDDLNCSAAFKKGKVVGQNPPAGFRAAPDSRVNLRISCTTSTSPGARNIP